MGEGLTALFSAPQLFLREWIEIGSGGIVLFFLLLYLRKRQQLVFAAVATFCLLLAALFQSLSFPFWQFLAEKGAILVTGVLVVKLLSPASPVKATLASVDLAPLIFEHRHLSALFIFPTTLSLDPYLKGVGHSVPFQKEPIEKWMEMRSDEGSLALFLDRRSRKCSFVKIRGKENEEPLTQALYLSAKTDAHIIATEEGNLVHVFREKKVRIESVEKLADSLQQIDEERG